ncbi:MAG: diguanylate cyclase, partial [Betaproteobacteria bacterium]|nr:diguanylate cyclase [Betaproteobacteria bacterium]
VISEGVETAQQLDFLKSLGSDEYQGYYMSKPLPATEFEQWLHADSNAKGTSALIV